MPIDQTDKRRRIALLICAQVAHFRDSLAALYVAHQCQRP